MQVSGLVVTGDSLTPLPYATVYRARDQRGAMTDMNGFFSLPALEGDTIQFSSTGYITRHIVIEESGEKNRISIEVRRASQTHHAPHIGFPQSAPVTSVKNEKTAPTGAMARAATSARGCRQTI